MLQGLNLHAEGKFEMFFLLLLYQLLPPANYTGDLGITQVYSFPPFFDA